MLKCHLDKDKNKFKVKVTGNMISILADVTYVVRRIYESLMRDDPISAMLFKEMFLDVVNDDRSPVFQTDDDGVTGVSIRIPKEFLKGEEDDA